MVENAPLRVPPLVSMRKASPTLADVKAPW